MSNQENLSKEEKKAQRKQFLRVTLEEEVVLNEVFHLQYSVWDLLRKTFIRYRYFQREQASRSAHLEPEAKRTRRSA